MAKNKIDIKALILAPLAGFRTECVTVEEWGGIKFILREPSPEGIGRFQEVLIPPEPKEGEPPVKLSVVEEIQRNIRADAVLFIDTLFDEDGSPVFSRDDLEKVAAIYGPVHKRLLDRAMKLPITKEAAEKKSESQKPSS